MLKISRQVVHLLLIIVATSALISCGRTSPDLEAPSISDTATVPSEAISPVATVPPDSVVSPQATPTVVVDDGFASVRGVLTLMDPTTFAPQEDGLYLVPIDEAGGMTVPSVDPETSIQAVVDEVDGSFYFGEVPVGLYALMAVSDSGLRLSVRSLESGQTTFVSVDAADLGGNIDLGRLRAP